MPVGRQGQALVVDYGGRSEQTLPDGTQVLVQEDGRALVHPGETFRGRSYEELEAELARR